MKSTLAGRSTVDFGDHSFRKTTEPAFATDPVTGTETRDLLAAGYHDARGIRSGNIGESGTHLIATAGHQVIHVADGRSVDIDQDLIRTRARFGRIGET